MNIKEKILNNISDLIDKQNAKGLKKYGQSIDDCLTENYDWQNMIIEELIDALQYQQKQMQESEDEKLELAVANENLLKENRVRKNREQELETQVNYYKGKSDQLEREKENLLYELEIVRQDIVRHRNAINEFFDLDGNYKDIVNRAEMLFYRLF